MLLIRKKKEMNEHLGKELNHTSYSSMFKYNTNVLGSPNNVMHALYLIRI